MTIKSWKRSSILSDVKYSSFMAGNYSLSGTFNSIATQTIGIGGATSVTFSSIPSTFTHLQIRVTARSTTVATNSVLNLSSFNSDTGANYSYHTVSGDGSGVAANGVASQTLIQLRDMQGSTGTANSFGVFIIDILDYANTNKYKTVKNLSGYDSNGSGFISFDSGLWMNTAALNSITLSPYTGFAQYSSIALYGVN